MDLLPVPDLSRYTARTLAVVDVAADGDELHAANKNPSATATAAAAFGARIDRSTPPEAFWVSESSIESNMWVPFCFVGEYGPDETEADPTVGGGGMWR
jgi:hypothetical protein